MTDIVAIDALSSRADPTPRHTPPETPRVIVAVASLDRIESLFAFVRAAVSRDHAPIVIVEDGSFGASPDALEPLAALARGSAVQKVSESVQIEREHIYVVAHDRVASFTDGGLRFEGEGTRSMARRIDRMLASAADVHGNRAIAVLCGASTDGQDGLLEVLGAGGAVYVTRETGSPEPGLAPIPAAVVSAIGTPSEIASRLEEADLSVGAAIRQRTARGFRPVEEDWIFLSGRIIPALIERGRENGRVLRCWSLACPTGVEPYTLAILLVDRLGEELADWKIKIFATNTDLGALDYGRRAVYPAAMMKRMPEELRARFFERSVHGFRIAKAIRRLVTFGRQDAADPVGFASVDLVVSTNVPSLAAQRAREALLPTLAWSLAPNEGCLWTGRTRHLEPLPDAFEAIDPEEGLYRVRSEKSVMRGVKQTAEGASGPGVVIVDADHRTLLVNENARALLSAPMLAAGEDLLSALSLDVAEKVRLAIERTISEGAPVDLDALEVADGAIAQHRVSIRLAPIDGKNGEPYVLIEVNEADPSDGLAERLRVARAKFGTLVGRLGRSRRSLLMSRDALQAVNEEIGAAFDQLLSSKGAIERAASVLESTSIDFDISRAIEPPERPSSRAERDVPPPALLDDVHDVALAMFESATGCLQAASKRYLELVDRIRHVPRDQCLGRSFDDAFVGASANDAGVLFRRVSATNTAERLPEVRLKDGDLDLVWDITVSPASPYVIVSMVDVTQHVRMKEEKQRFLLAASQELKAPLIPLSGYADLLSSIIEDHPRPPDLDARLPAITGKFTKQVKQLQRLIDDIADVAHAESGKLTLERRWLPLPDLLRRAVRDARARSTSPEIALAIADGAETCTVFADDGRLLQVMANLLDNVFRHAPTSKTVDIELRLLDEGPGQPCEIAVRDHGPGIDPEVQRGLLRQLLFARSENSRRGRLGLGLGLYIARAIVEQHGGTIAFESQLGKGTKFFVRLPARAGARAG